MNTCRRTTKISDDNPAFAMRELHELYYPDRPIDEEWYYKAALYLEEEVEVSYCVRCKRLVHPPKTWCNDCLEVIVAWE